MNTRLRLLLMFLTCAGLFAGTWYFFGRTEREQNQLSLAKPKTTAELLVGTWDVAEQDPPIAPDFKCIIEYTNDGKVIIRATHFQLGPIPSRTGIYQLTGETIRFDYPEDTDNPSPTWIAKIETITDYTLVLVGSGERTKRMVCKRLSGD